MMASSWSAIGNDVSYFLLLQQASMRKKQDFLFFKLIVKQASKKNERNIKSA